MPEAVEMPAPVITSSRWPKMSLASDCSSSVVTLGAGGAKDGSWIDVLPLNPPQKRRRMLRQQGCE